MGQPCKVTGTSLDDKTWKVTVTSECRLLPLSDVDIAVEVGELKFLSASVDRRTH